MTLLHISQKCETLNIELVCFIFKNDLLRCFTEEVLHIEMYVQWIFEWSHFIFNTVKWTLSAWEPRNPNILKNCPRQVYALHLSLRKSPARFTVQSHMTYPTVPTHVTLRPIWFLIHLQLNFSIRILCTFILCMLHAPPIWSSVF